MTVLVLVLALTGVGAGACSGADAGARCCSLEYVSVAVGADAVDFNEN